MATLSFAAIFLLTLFLTLFFCFFYFLLKLWWSPLQIQRNMQSQGIHGPPSNFIYGNKFEILKMKMESMSNSLHLSDNNIFPRVLPHTSLWINKYGKNYLQWDGSVAELIVSDPEMVKEILHNREQAISKVKFGGYVQKIFGNGLSTSDGEKWVKARRIADFAFHGDLLKNMVPTMVSCAEAMLEKWKENHEYDDRELDLFEEFKEFSSDVIAHTAFGSSYLDGKVIFESLNKMAMMIFRRQFNGSFPGIKFLVLILRSKLKSGGEELERIMKDSITAIINEREEKVTSGEADNYGSDFLGLLLKAKNDTDERQRISLDDVLDECKTVYFAGQETTSVLLSWTSFLLATHTDWQEEARKEVFNVFGNNNPTLEGIAKLRKISMIIKETLRLYPPALTMLRKVKKEVRLGKLIVPSNIQIRIPTIAIHHDTAIWGEDAHEFKPERFSEEAMKNIPSAAYLPFGMGARNCVGSLLAVNETKIALSMILQRYSFTISPAHVHAPYQFLTLSPQHGVLVKLHSVSDKQSVIHGE